jgi:NAD(P)-dependent dehydrogenase (short-subunit alcohol dehydrogenase family)
MTPFILPHFTNVYHHNPYSYISPCRPELSTAEKCVCITGAAGGIGSAMARAYLQSRVGTLVLIDHNAEGLHQLQQNLFREFNDASKLLAFPLDITDTTAVKDAFHKIECEVGALDILINNAGYHAGDQPALSSDINQWFKSFDINTKGSFLVVLEFLKHARPDATVINVSSFIAHYGIRQGYVKGNSAYSASKLATTRTLEVLQEELPLVRIINLHPGMVPTAMARKAGNEDSSPDSGALPLLPCTQDCG